MSGADSQRDEKTGSSMLRERGRLRRGTSMSSIEDHSGLPAAAERAEIAKSKELAHESVCQVQTRKEMRKLVHQCCGKGDVCGEAHRCLQ